MRTWSGIIAMEGTPTGDGRVIEENALSWLDEPMPLRYVHEDVGMHGNAITVGQIVTVERDGLAIRGTGTIDDSFPEGAHALKMIEQDMQAGVSIDPDEVDVEFRSADGGEVTDETEMNEVVQVMTAARIRAATLVAIPAFVEAKITVDEAEAPADPDEVPVAEAMARVRERWGAAPGMGLTAAAPVLPPADWFTDPQFDGPTKLRIDGDRVFGHLATWGTCHIGFGDRCVQPPVSHANYAHFTTGTLVTAEGTEVAVGTITMDAPHADRRLNGRSASAHYDHTGVVAADVAIGEDEFGVWFSGALRPHMDDERKRALRASALSGDWRKLGGSLELVAALAVNVPGFPIVETQIAASGCPDTLIATGVVFSQDTTEPSEPSEPSEPQPSAGIKAGAAALAARIGRDPASRRAELVQRVRR